MDQLWAPWRLSYVAAPKHKHPTTDESECFICRGVSGTEDRANLVLYRSELSVVVLNRFPYNNGHLLVCPMVHKGRLDELTTDELLDLQLVLRKLIAAIEKRMSPTASTSG